MNSILIKKFKNKNEAIKKAVNLLKTKLKKGDIILTSPKFSNIRLKLMNLTSYIISKFSRGITHSCIYLGKNQVLDINFRFKGRDIQILTLKQLLKRKIISFKELKVYVVQPKKYKNYHRDIVLQESKNTFLRKSKNIIFSTASIFNIMFILLFNKSLFYKKEKAGYKNKWHCSNLVAYILKKSGVPIWKSATSTFIPSTFIFSRYFKIKKKIILK